MYAVLNDPNKFRNLGREVRAMLPLSLELDLNQTGELVQIR